MESSTKDFAEQLADARLENERLRNSVAALEAALADAERSAQNHLATADSLREEVQHFVYAASHDLQQPLSTVWRYTQLLERHAATNEQLREFSPFIIEGVERMNALIQDLLTYSRAGSSNRRDNIKLNSSLQWALLKLSDAIGESSASVTFGELPEVFADEQQMALVFENLLGNSLKFRAASQPEIRIAAEEGSGEYVISVSDNGPGVEERFQREVFLPFKRLHGKNVPGSGLGLAICQKIVRAHDGRIWLESDGRQGTTVKFALPM